MIDFRVISMYDTVIQEYNRNIYYVIGLLRGQERLMRVRIEARYIFLYSSGHIQVGSHPEKGKGPRSKES